MRFRCYPRERLVTGYSRPTQTSDLRSAQAEDRKSATAAVEFGRRQRQQPDGQLP